MSNDRYHRQMLLPEIGAEGQARLAEARVLVIGCGALGCGVSDLLTRAGVGHLRLIDRDVVEPTNLQRQVLFDQEDADHARPKAIAAAARLKAINPTMNVEPVVDDFRHDIALQLTNDIDVLVDGLDNLEGRYLLNDVAVHRGLPYVYAGAVGTEGLVTALLPQHSGQDGRISWPASEAGPCLRCLFPEPPPSGTLPTCDTAGVLGPTVAAVTAHQASLTMRLICAGTSGIDRSLHSIDPWHGLARRVTADRPRDDCPCCSGRQFEWLEGKRQAHTEILCGRSTVQIRPARPGMVNLEKLATRWQAHGHVAQDQHALRLDCPDGTRLTVFADGRALVGADDLATARALYAQLIGS
ncbi:MAG: ThiF family adenylyltransferase [Phycisphaerales bacterium]|nr:ThiF family adenylyltransferase [Phycisphaerales bacterium]